MGERNIDSLNKEVVELDGVRLNVITVAQLYEMKLDSSRAKDVDDAIRLKQLRGADLR